MLKSGPIIIAVCALGLSFWQGYLARQHNHLSVKPILQMWYDAKNLKDTGDFLYLKNCGFGPAVITRIKFQYSNKDYEYQRFHSISNHWNVDLKALAKSWDLSEVLLKKMVFYPEDLLQVGQVIEPNEEISLMSFRSEIDEEIENWEHIYMALLASLGITFIEIEYESVYREQYSMNFEIYHKN